MAFHHIGLRIGQDGSRWGDFDSIAGNPSGRVLIGVPSLD
jgi:hypothetical protein